MDFLRILEPEHRIQSADAVVKLALAAGRTPSFVQQLPSHKQAIRDTIANLVRTRPPA